MTVAALYDVHGNLPALEAVLDEVREAAVDLVVVGGDVLPGPMARECLEVLLGLDLPVRFIRGNGEREVLAERAGSSNESLPEAVREVLRWVAGELDDELAAVLEEWPLTHRVDAPDRGGVLFCHATPASDSDVFTRLTPDARVAPLFDGVRETVVVCGHTHMQFDRTLGGRRIVNAGSVGMPFGEPGAYWLLLDEGVHLRRTEYDLASAAERMRATRYPGASDFVDRYVLAPPSEDAMLEAFGGG